MALTPDQFLTQVKLGRLLPAYLFLGPDAYRRDKCRRALIEYWLAEGTEREEGLTRLDLSKNKLTSLDGVAMNTALRWLSAAEPS